MLLSSSFLTIQLRQRWVASACWRRRKPSRMSGFFTMTEYTLVERNTTSLKHNRFWNVARILQGLLSLIGRCAMMKSKRSGWAALLGGAFLLYGSGAAVAGALYSGGLDPNGNIVVTVDENGNGTINGFLGLQPLPSWLQQDPGPRGIDNFVAY